MCSFTLALLGIEALDLQKVDSPSELVCHHALLRDFNADDASVRQAVRERLGVVNETIAAMMDSHKSERRAVGVWLEHCLFHKWRPMFSDANLFFLL